MPPGELDGRVLDDDILAPAEILKEKESKNDIGTSSAQNHGIDGDDDLQITCFSEDIHDVMLHFQIIRLYKQIYVWIGCNSTKLGHLYAAASTRPNNMVSVTSLLRGASDNTGSGIARRLVLKTGLNIILACNIPKDSPMLEAAAERKLIQKLTDLGYTSKLLTTKT